MLLGRRVDELYVFFGKAGGLADIRKRNGQDYSVPISSFRKLHCLTIDLCGLLA